ncbi:hypothetical protein NQ314_013079 [Rhamnusium bicolor]|uniref:Retrotransposon gag domain-containing protein n=1 Tax=Rhamnusium bicolor TaxID=1586634 RepID=A0AAV8X8Z0_9CUCU|nr:hypothetical protein NQ314_013079 [Rhamnusium bicolor]
MAEAELKRLTAQLGTYKAKLTRFGSFLDSYIDNSDSIQLQMRLDAIINVLPFLDNVQIEIECIDDQAEAEHNKERTEFEKNYFQLISRAKTLLTSIFPTLSNDSNNECHSSLCKIYKLKKEQIESELAKFGLDPSENVEEKKRRLVRFIKDGCASPLQKSASLEFPHAPPLLVIPPHREPAAFLVRLHEICPYTNIRQEQLLPVLPELLQGLPLLWYRNNKSHWRTWDKFIKDFRTFYFPVNYPEDLEAEISRHLQKPDESATDYLTELETLLRRHGDMSPEQELQWIYRNLLPDYRQYTSRSDFDDVSSLTEKTKEFERLPQEVNQVYKKVTMTSYATTLKMKTPTERPLPPPIRHQNPPVISQVVPPLTLPGNNQSAVPTKNRPSTSVTAAPPSNRNNICWHYGKAVHVSSQCRSPPRLYCSRCGQQGIMTRDCQCTKMENYAGTAPIRGTDTYYIRLTEHLQALIAEYPPNTIILHRLPPPAEIKAYSTRLTDHLRPPFPFDSVTTPSVGVVERKATETVLYYCRCIRPVLPDTPLQVSSANGYNRPHVSVQMYGRTFSALIDTGAIRSYINNKVNDFCKQLNLSVLFQGCKNPDYIVAFLQPLAPRCQSSTVPLVFCYICIGWDAVPELTIKTQPQLKGEVVTSSFPGASVEGMECVQVRKEAVIKSQKNELECPIFGASKCINENVLPTYEDMNRYFNWVEYELKPVSTNPQQTATEATKVVAKKIAEIWARTLDRYGISDRAGAAVASAVLQDVVIINAEDKSSIIDKNKIRRARRQFEVPNSLIMDGSNYIDLTDWSNFVITELLLTMGLPEEVLKDIVKNPGTSMLFFDIKSYPCHTLAVDELLKL